MATDPTNVVVPLGARLYLAAVGTTGPAGPEVAMPTGWVEAGLFTPDSLQWATDPTFEEARAHQSNYPIRTWQTGDAATLQVDLEEWSARNFRAVFGGGTFTEVTATPNYFKFSPPAIGSRVEVAACIHIVDGDKVMRRIVPRAEQSEGVSQSFSKTALSILPMRLKVLGGDVGDPWYDLYNLDFDSMDPDTLT